MKSKHHIFLTIGLLAFSFALDAQNQQINLDAAKVSKYARYMATRHGGEQGLDQFKQANKMLYVKEMWYFTESFYIKRNHKTDGITMDEGMIDITRFEQYRKPGEDAIVELPGFKDALVLIATNKLIYKPNY